MRINRTTGILALCLLTLACIASNAAARSDAPLKPRRDASLSRVEQWRQDLDYFAEYLPWIHVKPFQHLERAAFEAEMVALRSGVEEMADFRVELELMRVTAMMNEAYTRGVFSVPRPAELSLGLRILGADLVIDQAPEDRAALLGGKVLRIGDHPAAEVFEALRPYVPHETEGGLFASTPGWLLKPRVLHGLGLIADPDRMVLQVATRSGDQREEEFILPPPGRDTPPLLRLEGLIPDPPLYARRPDQVYWSELIEEGGVAYCRFRYCREMQDHVVDLFTANLLTAIDRLDAPPRFILDLRGNVGGNGRVLDPIIETVGRRIRDGRIRDATLLVDGHTSAAASTKALDFLAATGALVAGETTGSRVNQCGQSGSFTLPHSGFAVYFPRECLERTEEFEELMPDIPVTLTIEDLLAGRDPVLEAVLARGD